MRPATGDQVATIYKVHPRTPSNWASKGYITAYEAPTGEIYYNLDEIDEALTKRPRTQMRDGRLQSRLGANARVKRLPVLAVEPEATS
ncbi:hypothetical protein [Demequina maris]|uniref:hypothetical protein n=1 Tax=Demequina maris TaxID=1638982 RepID=UPI000784C1DF|nr:hypothetical protein [Demequina maris]